MSKSNTLASICLSKSNLIHNFKILKSLAKKGTKFSVAIKGNAYGHGQNVVAKILEPYVDYFQVDDLEELELLRKVSSKKTLLLGFVQKKDLLRAAKLGCILSIFSVEKLKELNKVAKDLNIKQEIHIPIDAYLGREGVLANDLPDFLEEVLKYKNIKFTGVYAHFANIEDTKDFSHAQKQIDEYHRGLNIIKKFNFSNLQTHISATSGLLVYEKGKGINTLVRLGLGVYGMWPSKEIEKNYENKITLKPVLVWKTKIAQIKVLPKNYPIGYGLTYKTKKETKVALIPQGYADGFDRRLSNRGEVLVGGIRCKILGRVMMNMFVVDVNNLKKVTEEDEVVIIGRQGREEITVEELAKKIETINYEVVSKISPLLPRIVV
jgi:alanine racemase